MRPPIRASERLFYCKSIVDPFEPQFGVSVRFPSVGPLLPGDFVEPEDAKGVEAMLTGEGAPKPDSWYAIVLVRSDATRILEWCITDIPAPTRPVEGYSTWDTSAGRTVFEFAASAPRDEDSYVHVLLVFEQLQPQERDSSVPPDHPAIAALLASPQSVDIRAFAADMHASPVAFFSYYTREKPDI